MQETKKTGLGLSEEVALKTAVLSLRSRLYRVSGSWHWPMQSDALYCSDAMDFPADVEGTKAIFHPDDLPTVSSALELLQTEEIELLSFRIITTYGEVKEVTGTGIGLQKEAPEAVPVAPGWEEAVNDWARLKAFEDLSQHRMGTDAAEKMQGTGLWYINKATAAVFYSDGVFRLHGLPPQSLNAHPNTFYPFIHPEDQATVEEALDRAYRQEVPLHLDYRVVLQSGEERHLRLTTTWGFNRQGQALFTGLLQNITASVEGEGRLQQAAADVDLHGQLLTLSERHAAIGHWHVNLLTRKTVFSANLNRLYGMKAGLPPTKNVFLGFVHADDREAVEKANNKMYREHTPPEIEFRLVRPDGKERWMRQTAKLVVSGDALLMIGAVQDVTVLKGLEKKTVELKDAALLQEALNNGLENISGVRTVVWWTADSQMSWSPGFYHLLGYKPGTVDASQALWHRQIHPSDLKAFKDTVTLVTNGQHVPDLTFRLVNKGGIRHFRLRFETFNTGAREGVIGFAENITTAMAANRDRAAVEQLQQAIYNTVTDAIILTDEQNTVTAWNRAAADITGIAEQEAVQQNLFDLLPNLHQRSFLDRLQQVRSGEAINIVVTKEEWYGRGPHQAFITPLLDAEGALYAVLHVVRDTTREQSLRKQLSQRLNFIESLVEASAERIVVLDAGMNYLYWNRKAEEWYGIDKERVLGRNILELFPGFRSDPGYAEFRKVLRGEHVFLPAVADESGRHFENHLSPIKNEEGDVTAVLWAVHDRTKEWELKNQSQKALEILNALNENFLELDRKFRVVFVNSKALQFFDKTEADVQGKVLWDIYPELIDTALHLALEHAVQERVPVRDEFTSPAHGVTLLVSIAPTGTGVAVAFSDIQFIKDAEHKLAEEHRRLKEAQSIGAIGSFEWTFGADEVAWSDEMYRVCNLEPQSQRITIGFTESLVLPEDLPRLLDLKESSFVTPGNYELQHRILLFDGTIKWVQHRFESLADEAGNIVRIHGTLQDISELKAAEERLAVEHRRLNEAQTVGRVGSFEWTVGDEAVQWSAEMFRINGLDPATKESKASTIEEVIHPNDRTAFEQKKAASLKVPGRYGLVHRILINGEEKCVNHQWESVAGDDGTVQRVRGIVQDVTEQKNAERELQRTKDLLQDIIDAPNIGLAVYKAVRNNQGQIVDFVHEFINRTTLTALGQDFTGRLLSEHGEEGTAQLQKFIEALETEKSNSYTKQSTLNGAPHWVGFSNAPLDGDRLIHTWEDITERKVAEQELLQLKDAFAQRAVDKYHKIITSMEQGFCVLECLFNQQGTCINWRYLDANPVFKKQSGYEAVIGKTVNDLVPDVEQGWKDMYGAVALTGRPERREDYVQATNRWYDVSAFRIDSPEERHVAVLFNDITGRKHREQQQAFLLTFSDSLRTLPNKEAIEETSLQLLAGFLNLDRAYIATVYKQDDRAVIGPEYRRPHLHLAPISGEQHMATLPESFGQVDVQTLVVNDMDTNAALLEQHRQPLGATSLNALVAASVRQGEQAVVWSLVASTTTPRNWTRDEVLLIEAVAERTWAAAERAEAEKEIRFSESRFRILAETLPLIISLAAPDGTLQYINHWWTEFSGKSAEAFMTGDWLQAIHPDDRDTVVQAWQNALATGERYQYEFRALSKDGSYRWLLARGLPVKEDDGTITNWVNTALDIHDRKEGEEKLQGFAVSLEEEVKHQTRDLQKNLAILKQTEDIAAIGSWEYYIPSGRFSWSDGMYRIFGRPPGGPVEPEVYIETAAPEDLPVARRIVHNLRSGHQPFEETICIRRGNEQRLLKVQAMVVNNKEGQPEKVVGVDLDVTDLMEVEQKLRAHRHYAATIFDASVDQMTVFDKDLRFLAWNKKAEEVGGLKKEEVIGKTISEVFPSIVNEPEFLEAQAKALAGEPVYIPAKRGIYSTAYQQWFYVPLKDEKDRTYAVLNIIHDITDKVQAEELLKQKNQELEDKNNEIAHFNFIASHDLKEPLRKLGTFSNWLAEREGDALSPVGKKMLEKLVNAVGRMNHLVEDISTLTRLQAVKDQQEQVDLNTVLKAVLLNLQASMAESGAVVDAKHLPTITGYREQLEYLFTNLLTNAIKFQSAGVMPVVELRCNRVQHPKGMAPGDYYHLSFSDNGIGFDPQYADKIFRVFQRLHGHAEYPGTGMGLAICRRVMENHGGLITATGRLGKGARFDCWFVTT